ncbi:MAG: NUDIX hydrolase [Dehalococcoidia bacterium]|nr:NUDIX hydrolase [Dehalococcoidia bacterium]
MEHERTISSRQVYEGRVLNLRVDSVELSGGRSSTREIIEHRGAVVIAAVDGSGNVLMVRQFRKPVEQELLELPAGTLESGEDPEACASRELQEETGFRAEKLEKLGGFYSAPGFCTEYLHLFLATGLQPSPLAGDDDEDIRVAPTPISEVPSLIASGEIRDAKSVAGLLRVLRERFPGL